MSRKIWIYQSVRELLPDEVKEMQKLADEFVHQWASHGTKLSAEAEVRHHRFLILKVDEKVYSASGCSIDRSVAFVKELEKRFNTDFFDRMQVAFRDNGDITLCHLNDLRKLHKEGKISRDTLVFNNLIETDEELGSSWEVPIRQSWHDRFL